MAQRARYRTKQILRDMASRGLDRKWLAENTGFSKVTIGEFFKGRMTVKVGAAIAKALGHEPGYYLIDVITNRDAA